jgi:hypothetical protein
MFTVSTVERTPESSAKSERRRQVHRNLREVAAAGDLETSVLPAAGRSGEGPAGALVELLRTRAGATAFHKKLLDCLRRCSATCRRRRLTRPALGGFGGRVAVVSSRLAHRRIQPAGWEGMGASSTSHEHAWGIVRFTLGMAQMAAATAAGVLLIETGVSVWSLAAAVVACSLTTTSVLLFGSRRRSPSDRTLGRER